MKQAKSKMIGGIRVVWTGYAIEFDLPSGFGGDQLSEYIDKNADDIESFKESCEG